MANRIKGLDGGSIGPGSSNPIEKIRPSNAVGGAATGEASPTVSKDSVDITPSARAMTSLSQAIKDTPDIDSGRVAAVQQAIDSGQYTINPGRIADRLVQLEQDLGSAKAP